MQPVVLLTVFLQIHIWRSALAVPLLTVAPVASHYTPGQSVTLTCTLSSSHTADGFIFIKDETELGSFQALGQRSRSYLLPQLSVKNSGRYSCRYWKKSPDGRNFTFSESNPVWISMHAPTPPAPSLSSDLQESLPGEQVTLHCSAPSDVQVKQYQFFDHEGNQISNRVPHLNGSAWLTLTAVNSGEYTCRYLDKNSFSGSSRPIRISLIDPPPRPVLKVDPPFGEVKEGNHLVITCLTNRSNTEKKFHFSKDSIEIISTHDGFVWSSKESGDASMDGFVTIPQATLNHTGGFACKYEEKMSSRWVSSPWSQKVNITVGAQDPSTPLGYYAAWAIPLLIFIAPFIYYCRRRKKASKGQQELEPTETNEEIDSSHLGTLEPQAAALQGGQGSGITYAAVRFCSVETSWKPMMANGLEPEEDEGMLYSKVRFQPTNRAANKIVK